MAFWQQRRIPITRGWGPCKRTNWVPVQEHYAVQCSDGVTRVRDWRVGLNPVMFGPPMGGGYWPNDTWYGGFRERRPNGDFVFVPRDDGWDNREVNNLLDDLLARRMQDNEDRRAGAERRADAARAVQKDYEDQIRAIEGRFGDRVNGYADQIQMPISDERLTGLRAEAEIYAQRERERREHQAQRDLDRRRELLDREFGRSMRRDMERDGFVYMARHR